MRLMQFIGLRRLLPRCLRRNLRGMWNRLLDREHRRNERKFYCSLIRPNHLVFDVGANRGSKVTAFLGLGARVIAIEPSPDCTRHLLKTYPHAIANGRLHVEEVAVAAQRGELVLTVIDAESGVFSGSPDFLDAARVGRTGTRSVSVRAVTLDDLVAKYGSPNFIKIDIEGMDVDALRGLTSKPPFLSFEYNTAGPLLENTRECFRQAVRLGFREANLTEATAPRLVFQSWVGVDAALAHLEKWRMTGNRWGDVVVR
jgi:FkbM family methyltransferase